MGPAGALNVKLRSAQAAFSIAEESLLTKRQSSLNYETLIERCLKGERRAQRELFDRFAGKLLYLCRRYAADDAEAEDMMQEGFIRVFKNLHKYKGEGSFEGWVRRVFVNTAIKYYHRMQKHSGHVQIETAINAQLAPGALAQLSEQELLKLIQALPEGYRVVFNMYAIEGYSHKEISEVLGIGESTSRSQLVKARKLLQTQVSDLQKVSL
jgi:RNA polymerase sigma factor (sigma-70 family)